MKASTILTFTIISLFGCNDAPKSEGNEKETAPTAPSAALNEIQIQPLEDWPDAIEGCSCYSSGSKKEFENRNYIYLDDYQDLAFMKINGQLEKFSLFQSDTLSSSVDSRKIWTNENFEVIIETRQIGQIDETWQHKGKLILKSNDGEVIEQEIYGECGC